MMCWSKMGHYGSEKNPNSFSKSITIDWRRQLKLRTFLKSFDGDSIKESKITTEVLTRNSTAWISDFKVAQNRPWQPPWSILWAQLRVFAKIGKRSQKFRWIEWEINLLQEVRAIFKHDTVVFHQHTVY